MIKIVCRRALVAIAGAAILLALATPPDVLAGQKPAGAKKKDAAVAKPTAEQIAGFRKALELRHASVRAAMVKARSDGEALRRAFLDRQRAELEAENAKTKAEIVRRRGSVETQKSSGP